MTSKTAKGGAEARLIRKALKRTPGRRLVTSNPREAQGELRLSDMSGATFDATTRSMPDVVVSYDREAPRYMLALL